MGRLAVFALEATGSLHRRRRSSECGVWPVAAGVRAVRDTGGQEPPRRCKTDDRDCAALVWLARQGAGRPATPTRHRGAARRGPDRRGLVARKVEPLQQRLHDQLNALCPGLSAPAGMAARCTLEDPDRAGRAGLRGRVRRPPAVAAVAAGPRRRPADRCDGPVLGGPVARACHHQPTPSCAPQRLGGTSTAIRLCRPTSPFVDARARRLLADTPGQILTTLPGVAAVRAAGVRRPQPADRAVPRRRHLYAATGLAPAIWQSASVHAARRISAPGLAEHRDALMGIAWGLCQHSPPSAARPRSCAPAAWTDPGPGRARPPRLPALLALLTTQQPFDEARYRQARHSRGR